MTEENSVIMLSHKWNNCIKNGTIAKKHLSHNIYHITDVSNYLNKFPCFFGKLMIKEGLSVNVLHLRCSAFVKKKY